MAQSRIETAQPVVLVGEANQRDDDCACPDVVLAFNSNITNRVDLEQDCACSDRPFASDRSVDQSGTAFVQAPDTFTTDLPNGFRLAFSPHAPSGPSVLNSQAWARWKAFATPRPLKQPVDHIFADQHLIQPQGLRLSLQASHPETLTAWLHVTNACNLDCPYCYVRKSSARMSDETGLQAVERIFHTAQANGFQCVKLKYAGGEATLHFKLVHLLHSRARQLAQETGLHVREVVLSNGVRLRPEDADWLAESGIKLMISLDGAGEMQNRLRPLKGGGGTFDAVEATIDRVLLPRDIRPDISITITQLNAAGAANAVRWALERDLAVSLNFYRQNILSAAHEELALEESAIIDGMLAAYNVFESYLPTRPFFNGLLDRVQAEAHSHTCGVGLAYLVITHEGKLAQCQMHLDQPIDPTFEENMLPLVATGPIRNTPVDEKMGCQACPYRYRCTGGCPVETFRVTGRWDVQSPNCRIYKALLPVTLRLEGLRLLKKHGYLH
jgi:uncharacterized protein